MKLFYRRRLPHILPYHETVFITFRLAGSLPAAVIRQLSKEQETFLTELKSSGLTSEQINDMISKSRRLYFGKFDDLLNGSRGPHWLAQKEVAEIVERDIRYYNERDYRLVAYCIMPNHVHLLVTIINETVPFYRILQSLKRHSARQANKFLNRTGETFWHEESYDHMIRHADEMRRVIRYILNNPVKAGLIADWKDWPYSFLVE